MKFDELNELLVKDLENNNSNLTNLNKRGLELLQDYNKFIETLKQWVDNDSVVNIISVISAEDKGTQKFKDANRLDTLTNGGKTSIDKTIIAIHDDDSIGQYLQ